MQAPSNFQMVRKRSYDDNVSESLSDDEKVHSIGFEEEAVQYFKDTDNNNDYRSRKI